MRKAVFFDRDGILNDAIVVDGKPHPPKSVDELVIKDGIEEILEYLKKINYMNICITNQPDWARGKVSKESIDKINNTIKKNLLLDDIFVCFHDDKDGCKCRKPKIGMLLDAKEKYNIDLSASWVIGDRASDIEAGNRAGCTTIFLDYSYSESKPKNADYIITNIDEIKEIIYIGY